MATSNRDRVGQMFDVQSPALDTFIAGVLQPALTKDTDWSDLVKLKDMNKGITGKTYSTSDPLVQLRMLTENVPNQVKKGWYPFDDVLGRSKELRERIARCAR